MQSINEMFGRVNAEGNVEVLFVESGELVTRIDENFYPVGSDLSVRYEHPEGITLTMDDAKSLGLDIE